MAPPRPTRPKVGRNPETPQKAEGQTIEPQVSVPMAKAAKRGSDDCAGTARRAARPAVRVPGIFRGSGCRRRREAVAQAAGQLDHRRFAQQHRARLVQLVDDRGVVIEALVLVRLCPPRCGISLHGQQIFRRIGNSVQRPAVVALVDFFFRLARLLQREFGRQRGVGIQLRAILPAALEVSLSKLDRRQTVRVEAIAQLAHAEIEDILADHPLLLCRRQVPRR